MVVGSNVTETTPLVSPGPSSSIARASQYAQAAAARGLHYLADQLRPWSELLRRRDDPARGLSPYRAAFGKPASLPAAIRRMRNNLRYFRRNYAIAALVVVGLSLLWHPVSLLVLAILAAAWIYLYFSRASDPVVIFGNPVSSNVVLVILSILTIVALFLTRGGTALITSLLLSLLLIALHAAFRNPDDLFLDDAENVAAVPASPVPPFVRPNNGRGSGTA